MNSPQNSCFYEFEGFVLDPLQRVVRTLADGQTLRLTARAFDALHLLVEHHGQLVDKETLIKTLWPKVVVEENNLTQIIYTLRQSLSEKPGEHRFIATVPGRGYQFVAAVKEIPRASDISVSSPTVPPSGLAESAAAQLTIPVDLAITSTGNKSFRPLLLWGAAALALFLVAGAWWLGQRNGTVKTTSMQQASPVATVAVLPFVNLTGDASKDYFGDGMAEELINTLANVPGLKVPARTSSFSYKGRNIDARQIAKELGVGIIVEGSVRIADKEIRITAQLINAEDGLHLWSETYDEQFTDIFKLQDKLATQIAKALLPNLSGDAQLALARPPPTQDAEAYRLYLQGMALIDRGLQKETASRAIELFGQAIARDPKFARAHLGLSRAHSTFAHADDVVNHVSPIHNEHMAAARKAFQTAVALDPGMTRVKNAQSLKPVEAEAEYRAALELDSSEATIHTSYAAHLTRVGHLRAALEEVLKAQALQPANAVIAAIVAAQVAISGELEEAEKLAAQALNLGWRKDVGPLLGVAIRTAIKDHRLTDLARLLVILNPKVATDPEHARLLAALQRLYGALADPAQRTTAIAMHDEFYPRRQMLPATEVLCASAITAYVGADALDAAFDVANKCRDQAPENARRALTLHTYSKSMRNFRRDPRYQAHMEQFGDLMEYWTKYGPPDNCELVSGKLTCN